MRWRIADADTYTYADTNADANTYADTNTNTYANAGAKRSDESERLGEFIDSDQPAMD